MPPLTLRGALATTLLAEAYCQRTGRLACALPLRAATTALMLAICCEAPR